MNRNYPDIERLDADRKRLRQEARLAEYRALRAEIRSTIELAHSRVSRTIAAMGFVVGYSLLAPGGEVFITLLPVMVLALVVLSIDAGVGIILLAERIHEIETEVEGLEWEHFYERWNTETRWRYLPQVSWVALPTLMLYALAALAYVASVAVSLLIVESNLQPTIAEVDSIVVAGGFYLVLTVLAGVVSVAYFKVERGTALRTSGVGVTADPSRMN